MNFMWPRRTSWLSILFSDSYSMLPCQSFFFWFFICSTRFTWSVQPCLVVAKDDHQHVHQAWNRASTRSEEKETNHVIDLSQRCPIRRPLVTSSAHRGDTRVQRCHYLRRAGATSGQARETPETVHQAGRSQFVGLWLGDGKPEQREGDAYGANRQICGLSEGGDLLDF